MIRFKQYIKYSFIALLLLKASVAKAQMDMSAMHHKASVGSKNIFLQLMDTMMLKMDQVPAASSTETDFIYQMIPHHEGAIEMANYEIRHGKNLGMIQLAKSIVAEQQMEIQQMHLWLKDPRHNADDLAAYQKEMAETMTTMMENMPSNAQLKDTDQVFARVMIPHHQAAIDMARVLLKYATRPSLIAYGKLLISNEQTEIEQMKQFIN